MIDLDRLEALAKAATPGPWTADECKDSIESPGATVYQMAVYGDGQALSPADQDYVAAAGPDVMLDLISQARAAQHNYARGLSTALAMLGDYTENLRHPERLQNAYDAISEALTQARCKRCQGTGSVPGDGRLNDPCDHRTEDQ